MEDTVFPQLLEQFQTLSLIGHRDSKERSPDVFAQLGRVVVGAHIGQLREMRLSKCSFQRVEHLVGADVAVRVDVVAMVGRQ